MRTSKMFVVNIGYRCTSEKGRTIKDLLVAPKDKDPITKKRVGSFIDTNVTGWNVLKSSQEHLARGSKNI